MTEISSPQTIAPSSSTQVVQTEDQALANIAITFQAKSAWLTLFDKELDALTLVRSYNLLLIFARKPHLLQDELEQSLPLLKKKLA